MKRNNTIYLELVGSVFNYCWKRVGGRIWRYHILYFAQCAAKGHSKAHQGRLLSSSFSHHKVPGYASYCTSLVLPLSISSGMSSFIWYSGICVYGKEKELHDLLGGCWQFT
jgi:hypothetical protein